MTMQTNKIPVPESVKVLTNVDVFDEGLKKFDFKVHIGLRKISSPTPCGSFGRRVINPLLNDKFGLFKEYMHYQQNRLFKASGCGLARSPFVTHCF